MFSTVSLKFPVPIRSQAEKKVRSIRDRAPCIAMAMAWDRAGEVAVNDLGKFKLGYAGAQRFGDFEHL